MTAPAPPPTRRAGRRRHRAARGTGLLLGVVLAFLVGTAWRLTQSGLALPGWAVAWVVERANRDLRGAELAVAGVSAGYDLGAQALRLGLRDARLSRGGAVVARLPSATVTLFGPPLLRGRLRPSSVAVAGLVLDAARDADGRWSLGFEGGGAPPGWSASLAALDAALARPVLSALDTIAAEGVRVRVSDAATGLSQELAEGAIVLRRRGGDLALDLSAALPLPGGAARLSGTVRRDALGARARLALDDVPIGALAAALPRLPALALVSGRLSAEAAFAIEADGTPGTLRGRMDATDARLVDRPRLVADRVTLGLAWRPGTRRVAVTEAALSAPEARFTADGQLLFARGLAGPIDAQLRLGVVELEPEGVFDRRVAFEDGVVEARLTQAPPGVTLGQAVLTGPSGTARARGRARFRPDGIEAALDLAVPRMAVGDLAALWPAGLAAGARRWFVGALPTGIARDVTAALRVAPGRAPVIGASLAFEDATVRYMRTMPPAEGAVGALDLAGGRLAVRVDRASVPAAGPSGPRDGAGRIAIDGTSVVLPDALARTPSVEVALRAVGDVGDVLAVLDNPPFRLLERIGRTPALARGRMDAEVAVALPIRRGNAPADVRWSVDAALADVASDRLVAGRSIAAEALRLVASPEAVEIAGEATFDGVPFEGWWRQPLPPPATEAAPEDGGGPAAPRAPVPPARIEGVATVTPDGLARLGVATDALRLSGETPARVAVDLPPGGPGRLSVRGDLAGLGAALPAIGWAKPAGRTGAFALDMTLAAPARIDRLSLDAPGLALAGSGRLAAEGGLDRLALDRVDAGWFAGPVTITGGASPRVTVRGGRADLRRAPSGGRGGGAGGGRAAVPLDLRLDTVRVTDGIALTGVRARLRGGRGTFSGRVAGAVPVEGAVAPRGGGTAVTVRGDDAGAALRALDLYDAAGGGSFELTLQPAGAPGAYDATLRGRGATATRAPALATLLQAISSGVGGDGLRIDRFGADFRIAPGRLDLHQAAAIAPGLTITARGAVDLARGRVSVEGVASPFRAPVGALFAEPVEGTFGVTYRLSGPTSGPALAIDPLSILAPGALRDLFRRPAATR